MLNRNFIEYAIKLLIKDKTEHFFSFIIFTFIVFILCSVLFISDSIKYDFLSTLGAKEQIVLHNTKAGRYYPFLEKHIDEIIQLNGVENVEGKVDGYYYFLQEQRLIHMVSDDSLLDEEIVVSKDIKELFEKFDYINQFNFLTQDAVYTKIIKKSIEPTIISSNTIYANSDVIREILEMKDDEYSYITIYVPNDSEVDFLARKIMDIFPSVIAKTKSEIQSNIRQIFYYKGGIFMIFYIVSMISFFILLKNQISSIFSDKKKEIAILRSIGFSIIDIVSLKFIQNSVISFSAFSLGFCFSYIFVFILKAPLLKNIFMGEGMETLSFTPYLDFRMLFILFVFTVIPFLAFILIPSWRVAIEDINEVMK